MIVLDTNVVSELLRPDPDRHVLAWIDQHSTKELWTTAMTAAELLSGVARLPPGRRRRALADAVDTTLTHLFARRILPFDAAAAISFSQVESTRRRGGRPISTADAVIAATCLAGGADILATRNTADFSGTGLRLLDPWRESATA